METRYRLRDLNNPSMTNEMAIDIIQKNMPDKKRNTVLFDALVKAIVALNMTSKDRRIEPRKENK